MTRKLTTLIGLLSSLGLSACSISTPFEGPIDQHKITAPQNETVYIGLTHATLKKDSGMKELFFDYVDQVEQSLPSNPGFLGFSKRMKLFGHEAWTMTVWKDEQSLQQFVTSETHQAAIKNAYKSLDTARFARVEKRLADVPISWDQALILLEETNRGY